MVNLQEFLTRIARHASSRASALREMILGAWEACVARMNRPRTFLDLINRVDKCAAPTLPREHTLTT